MNIAFMEKLGWRLFTESDKLWANILTPKYVRGSLDISKMERKKNSSNAWQGLVAATNILKKRLRQKVYNGASTSIARRAKQCIITRRARPKGGFLGYGAA